MSKDFLYNYANFFNEYFVVIGVKSSTAVILGIILNILIVGTILFFIDILVRKIVIQIVKIFNDPTEKGFYEFLMESNFPRFVAHFVPIAIVWHLLPIIFNTFPKTFVWIEKGLSVYLVILSILVFRSVLRTTKDFLGTKEHYFDKPLQSYVQILMIFAWGIGIFFIVNVLTNFNFKSVATLGATSAMILLIFKDTILGFVASIQVSVNDIVRIGDWITFSKFGADGYVTEISLATVRVQNFDNTFTTIPTYSLIADSFKNWRGMQESKGRRIKRSIYIKQNTVRFITPEMLEEFKKIQLIAPYVAYREKENSRFNTKAQRDKILDINGKSQTNLGVFRNYAESYLLENEKINQEMLLMVRHQSPTEKGIPLEVYCFTYDKTWENYEKIQADIFDHLIAAVPYFGLEIFESPTGIDFDRIKP
ncbi:MAG: miniconductance mechanosensitive channel [Patiriisocius sp.]|jgi:miniconductance mechanosensitive channel